MRKGRFLIGVVSAAVGITTIGVLPAGATGSVTAVDTSTGDVGSALASCTEATVGLTTDKLQEQIYFPVPGTGAVLGQSFFFGNKGAKMAALFAAGSTPTDIMNFVTTVNASATPPPPMTPEADVYDGPTQFQRRQYLISSMTARGAGHTGTSPEPLVGTPLSRGHEHTGDIDSRFEGVVGGNTLTSDIFVATMHTSLQNPADVVATLEQLLGIEISASDAATIRTGDLGERLFLTLAAGFGRRGEGDWRCVYGTTSRPPAGTPLPVRTRSSNQGWIRVDPADGGAPTMNLRFESKNNKDAIIELARMYMTCRLQPTVENCQAIVNDETPVPPQTKFGIAGTSLRMTAGLKTTLAVRGDSFRLKDFPADPRTDATSVRIKVDAPGTANDTDNTYSLPASGWTKTPSRFSYDDPRHENGPISDLNIYFRSGLLTLNGWKSGFAWNLANQPNAVDVTVMSGDYSYCMHFTGGRFTANRHYQVTKAPAPSTCG